jgi:hypothetical protein
MTATANRASPIKAKRRRATQDEMEQRAAFLIGYASEHGPVTVRQLYYQAEVRGLPGVDKTENGYNKIQVQVLKLRREGRLAYQWIADATRWMRKPRSFDSVEDAIQSTAALYRKNLWLDPTRKSKSGSRKLTRLNIFAMTKNLNALT